MADKKQSLDVWIVDTNTVYREVPFTVVLDWVQQGRLLENDQVRPAGTKEWKLLGSVSEVAAYLPKVEPFRAEDKAEALEPVQVDFTWKPRKDTDEGDVDMIPLIDVSLVLLIFFMMTASAATAAFPINMPESRQGAKLATSPLWIGIDRGPTGEIMYSIGRGEGGAAAEDRNLKQDVLLQRLTTRLADGPTEVCIKADKKVPYGVVKKMTVLVQQRRGKVTHIYAGVSERVNQ